LLTTKFNGYLEVPIVLYEQRNELRRINLMEILRQQRKVNIKNDCEIKKEKNHRTIQERKSQNQKNSKQMMINN
jgi:hypothetical protein